MRVDGRSTVEGFLWDRPFLWRHLGSLSWIQRTWRFHFGASSASVLREMYEEEAALGELPDGCDPEKEIKRLVGDTR